MLNFDRMNPTKKAKDFWWRLRLVDLWMEWTATLFLGGILKSQMSEDPNETKDFMERDLDDFICIHPFLCFGIGASSQKGHSIPHRGSNNATMQMKLSIPP